MSLANLFEEYFIGMYEADSGVHIKHNYNLPLVTQAEIIRIDLIFTEIRLVFLRLSHISLFVAVFNFLIRLQL